MSTKLILPFFRPVFSPIARDDHSTPLAANDEIASLPDLIRFNAHTNSARIFCLQAEAFSDKSRSANDRERVSTEEYTYKRLNSSVELCKAWLRELRSEKSYRINQKSNSPVALYMESHVSLFILMAALLDLEIPVLVISARLSTPSVKHLLEVTGTKDVIVSKRTRLLLEGRLEEIPELVEFDSKVALNSSEIHETGSTSPSTPEGERAYKRKQVNTPGSLILHSSGTTGLPKPIYLSQRYLLGYAACHELGEEASSWFNLSTLPLFHGFGLLAPCLSLSVGMPCCFPPPSIIPSASSTIRFIRELRAQSLMTVPNVIDDILCLPDAERDSALHTIRNLRFVAVGGGALSPSHRKELEANQVKLINHYGVTEIGAIAPIFCPGPEYDRRYLRIRSDLNLQLRPIPDSDRFRLIGFPIGSDSEFEIQDELEQNTKASRLEVRILGRTDDVIVLKTGEKVMPQVLESTLNSSPYVQTAVCIGSGRFEVVILVEPSAEAPNDVEVLTDHVWSIVSDFNPSLDQHSRVSCKEAIIIKPSGKPIPRSDKGSVMRRETVEQFKEEVENAYKSLELDNAGKEISLDGESTESGIRQILEMVGAVENIDSHDDFFEMGMDSLQSVRLARLLNSALEKYFPESAAKPSLNAEFVYKNPSIDLLSQAIVEYIHYGSAQSHSTDHDRSSQMHELSVRLYKRMLFSTPQGPGRHVVLLTGATGSLGVHVLNRLVRLSLVKKVICLIRKKGEQESMLARISNAVSKAGIVFNATDWAKVEVDESEPKTWVSSSDVSNISRFHRFAKEITHIIHLAWPMDFHRSLRSFHDQLEAAYGLANLARAAHASRPYLRIKLIFASSIAVARYHHTAGATIPEVEFQDPKVTTPFGYAEAKWVIERFLAQVGRDFNSEIEPVVVRIGQMSGPEASDSAWNISEHIPVLVKASQEAGVFPLLNGCISWIPVDQAALAMTEILVHQGDVDPFLHLENPVRQPWSDIAHIIGAHLFSNNVSSHLVPFDDWLEIVQKLEVVKPLEKFFRNHFRTLAEGSIILDTAKARAVSKTLSSTGGVSEELLVKYLNRWKRDGFLHS